MTFILASPLHLKSGATVNPSAFPSARNSPRQQTVQRPRPPVRAKMARFCMSATSSHLLLQPSVFRRFGKAARAPGSARPVKEMGLAVQQVPEKVRVTASLRSSDRSALISAEVPFGPICPAGTMTFILASPLHLKSGATVNPSAFPSARNQNSILYQIRQSHAIYDVSHDSLARSNTTTRFEGGCPAYLCGSSTGTSSTNLLILLREVFLRIRAVVTAA